MAAAWLVGRSSSVVSCIGIGIGTDLYWMVLGGIGISASNVVLLCYRYRGITVSMPTLPRPRGRMADRREADGLV